MKFSEMLKNEKIDALNEANNKKIAKEFLSYIGSMDFSWADWDMNTTSGIEDYLDSIEDEDDDGLSSLQDEVADIDDIRDAMREIGTLLKGRSKIIKIQNDIEKHKEAIAKLEKELSKYN